MTLVFKKCWALEGKESLDFGSFGLHSTVCIFRLAIPKSLQVGAQKWDFDRLDSCDFFHHKASLGRRL